MNDVVYREDRVSKESINWGSHTDPRGTLIDGTRYTVDRREVHSWHTKVYLCGVKGSFNSVWFEEVHA